MLAGALFAGLAAWAADSAGSITEISLAPHAFPRGKTMFVELPPEKTGMRTENRYADPKMWGELYQEFETRHRSAPGWPSATMTATAGRTSLS